MSHHPDLRVERDGHVTTVTIDRPGSKNACTGDMWVALGATFRDLSWSGARAVVLTGAGGDFCAGADLGGGGGGGGGGAGARRVPGNQLDAMRVLGDVVLAVHQCPVPVIAKVDGVAVGAGFGLALAADMTWCSDRARFSAIFAKRGLSLDFGTSWLLRQRVGRPRRQAAGVHRRDGERRTRARAGPGQRGDAGVASSTTRSPRSRRTIAAGPPIALSMTKRELDNAGSGSLAQALEAEALAQNVNTRTDDMVEAMTAYMERRPPELPRAVGADTAMTREWALGDVHDVVSAAVPDRTMIVHGERRRTYGEVNARSRALAGVPRRPGFRRVSGNAASWRAGRRARIASPSLAYNTPGARGVAARLLEGTGRAVQRQLPLHRGRGRRAPAADRRPGRDLRPPPGREAQRDRRAPRPADRDRRRRRRRRASPAR